MTDLEDEWIPAFAGMTDLEDEWIPAYAGMTGFGGQSDTCGLPEPRQRIIYSSTYTIAVRAGTVKRPPRAS